MSVLNLILLGVVIGANNLAVSLALGALPEPPKRWQAVSIFGAFEFVVPFVGMWLGRQASQFLADHTSWLGAALLAVLGVWTLVSGLRDGPRDEKLARRATSVGGLTVLALVLSVDNLVVGFSLGLGDVEPWIVAATIASFSMAFAWLGITAGNEARRHWEKWAGVGAGVVLLLLAGALAMGWL